MRALPLFALLLTLPLCACQSFSIDGEPLDGSARVSDVEDARGQFLAGNYGLAEEKFRRAVEQDSTNAQAWLGLAASYDLLRRFDLADRAYARAEKLSGRSAALLNNRGYSYLLRGDFNKARTELAAAQKLDPGNADIQTNFSAALKGQRI